MRLYLFRMTFHENLYYATREVGRLYETGRYLHNYAITYALGLTQAPYFQRVQIPRYAEELSRLNEQGIYVTPARGIRVQYQLVTFKYADNAYRVKMAPGSRNTPSYGRAKEVAVGSQFEFGVLSRDRFTSPRWIRMGLWRSKALVECIGVSDVKTQGRGDRVASLPLNPLDAPGELQVFDLISMPPSSLVENARMTTDWLKATVKGRTIFLPADMAYTFPEP